MKTPADDGSCEGRGEDTSNWVEQCRVVLQGFVLGPLLLLTYANDSAEGLESCVNMFADDAEHMGLICIIQTETTCKEPKRSSGTGQIYGCHSQLNQMQNVDETK